MNSLLISLAKIEQDAKDANMSLLVYFFYFEEAHSKWLDLQSKIQQQQQQMRVEYETN